MKKYKEKISVLLNPPFFLYIFSESHNFFLQKSAIYSNIPLPEKCKNITRIENKYKPEREYFVLFPDSGIFFAKKNSFLWILFVCRDLQKVSFLMFSPIQEKFSPGFLGNSKQDFFCFFYIFFQAGSRRIGKRRKYTYFYRINLCYSACICFFK